MEENENTQDLIIKEENRGSVIDENKEDTPKKKFPIKVFMFAGLGFFFIVGLVVFFYPRDIEGGYKNDCGCFGIKAPRIVQDMVINTCYGIPKKCKENSKPEKNKVENKQEDVEKCMYEDMILEEGDEVTKEDNCTICVCSRGKLDCDSSACDDSETSSEEYIISEGSLEGWNKYTNPDLGVSFEYPEEWGLEHGYYKMDESGIGLVGVYDGSGNLGSVNVGHITIFTKDGLEVSYGYFGRHEIEPDDVEEFKTMTIDGTNYPSEVYVFGEGFPEGNEECFGAGKNSNYVAKIDENLYVSASTDRRWECDENDERYVSEQTSQDEIDLMLKVIESVDLI